MHPENSDRRRQARNRQEKRNATGKKQRLPLLHTAKKATALNTNKVPGTMAGNMLGNANGKINGYQRKELSELVQVAR